MTEDDAITFPDEPRNELDRALIELVEQTRQVLQTQSRLRALVRATRAVASQLDLPTVLRTIVEAGVELSGARYGALGVLAEGGGLEQFIHIGMSDEEAHVVGHLPEGHGLLGALIDDPQPIRIRSITSDSRSAGFPAHHPAMDSFLGVPIRVRDAVYGNLYLTDPASGSFTEEDEELITALAATAGYAIDNARLFAETEARQAWSAAAARLTATLLAGEPEDAIAELVQGVQGLARAEITALLLPDDTAEGATVTVARGQSAEHVAGDVRSLHNAFVRNAIEGSQAMRLDDFGEDLGDDPAWPAGPALIVPLRDAGGALLALRPRGAAPFTPFELERAVDLTAQAQVALQLAAARAGQQRMLLLDDRTRIARDLHDHVIQQLFGAGLELQSVAATLDAGTATERIDATTRTLDDAISQIRTVIFALSPDRSTARGLRRRLIDVADELGAGLPRAAALTFSGPVDLVVTGRLADEVEAVVREALTNAVRHSNAGTIAVAVEADSHAVAVSVRDDGSGIDPAVTRRSGLRNLRERAERRGGSFTLDTGADGTRVSWRVPIEGGTV